MSFDHGLVSQDGCAKWGILFQGMAVLMQYVMTDLRWTEVPLLRTDIEMNGHYLGNNNCQWFHFIESPTRSTTWIRWKKTLGTLQGAGVRTLELHIFMWLALQWWLLELWPCNSSDAWHGKKHLRWLMAVHVLHLVTCHHVGVAINMILNRGILYTQQISTIRQNWTCLPCLRPFLDYMTSHRFSPSIHKTAELLHQWHMADDDTETQNAILEAMEPGCWEPLHLKKVPLKVTMLMMSRCILTLWHHLGKVTRTDWCATTIQHWNSESI